MGDLLHRRLEWFQDQKFGLFLHWGPYSQWGCIESWPLVEEDIWARPDDLKPWAERGKDLARFQRDYWSLNRTFNPTRFHPAAWAEAAKAAGMKYVVFTTKHHDGFCMFDTRETDYRITAPDCPHSLSAAPDIARAVFRAFREEGFGIGVYYSKADWHHPDYWSPESPAQTRNPNYNTLAQPEKWNRFVEFVHRQIEELMAGYGQVDILWLDAGQVRPPAQDLRMAEIAAMARRLQPGLIMVDRTVGGEFENYRTPEQEVPDEPLDYPWESCITMGTQWSYKPGDEYKPARELIHLLIDVVAKGGNLLLNIGPQPDGQLPPEALSRLDEIGSWMRVNGEAIYGTRPAPPYRQGEFAFTQKEGAGYVFYLGREELIPPELMIPGLYPRPGTQIQLQGDPGPVRWEQQETGIRVILPSTAQVFRSAAPVFRIRPAKDCNLAGLPGAIAEPGTGSLRRV